MDGNLMSEAENVLTVTERIKTFEVWVVEGVINVIVENR